jgi:hypothetical protein
VGAVNEQQKLALALVDRIVQRSAGDRGVGRRGTAGADAPVIGMEWKEFRMPDFEAIKAALRTPVVFDWRDLYAPAMMAWLGLEHTVLAGRRRCWLGRHIAAALTCGRQGVRSGTLQTAL